MIVKYAKKGSIFMLHISYSINDAYSNWISFKNLSYPLKFSNSEYRVKKKKNEREAFVESNIITIGNKDNSKAYTRYKTTQ